MRVKMIISYAKLEKMVVFNGKLQAKVQSYLQQIYTQKSNETI